MTPQDQTTFGTPGGNCFSACVASLLDIPVADVPYFMTNTTDPYSRTWVHNFRTWLALKGMYSIHYPAKMYLPEYHILRGGSPRSRKGMITGHAVVGFGDVICHDPHPSRAGLIDAREKIVLRRF